jgi:hypothetical protein
MNGTSLPTSLDQGRTSSGGGVDAATNINNINNPILQARKPAKKKAASGGLVKLNLEGKNKCRVLIVRCSLTTMHQRTDACTDGEWTDAHRQMLLLIVKIRCGS